MISILLATYNGEKYLREQLDSILAQTYQDFELIICDDCSKDGTVKILKDYASRDSRIRLNVNTENTGFKKNFQSGLSLCNGEYIAFCDQDDVWFPSHLETLITNIGDNLYIGADALVVDENLETMGYTMKDTALVKKPPVSPLDYLYFEINSNIFQGTASMGKRDFLLENNNTTSVVSAHDHWFALAACMKGKAVYIPEPILKYRQHQNNAIGGKAMTATQKVKDSLIRKIVRRWNYKKEMLKSYISICDRMINEFSDSPYINNVNEIKSFYENRLHGRCFKALSFFRKNYESLFLDFRGGKRYILRKINVMLP